MNWIKTIAGLLVGFSIIFWFTYLQASYSANKKSNLSLYNPIDTMNCKVTYLVNSRPQHNQKGFMILVNEGDTSTIKAFVVDSNWNEIECHSILELDVNPN